MHALVERHVYYPRRVSAARAGDQHCEQIRIPGIFMLGRYDHHAARKPLSPHRHLGQLEISLLAKGWQSYRVDGETYRMKGGEQFVTFPNELHDTAEAPEEKATMFWLVLETVTICDNWLFLAPNAAKALARKLNQLPHRHFYAHPQSHATMERIFELLRGPATRFRNIEIAHQLACYLFQTIEAARGGTVPPISAPIQRTLEFIARQRNDEWISLPMLAEQVGLSVQRFTLRFRHEMGVPPAEYILRRKLEMAKQRLAVSASVTDVAYDLGFCNSQYFATVFKKYEWQTPSQCKRPV